MAEIRLRVVEKGKPKRKRKKAARKALAAPEPERSAEEKLMAAYLLKQKIRKKAAREQGVEKLKKAADRLLGRHSRMLANLLLEKAVEGRLDSARLLVKLAESKKPPKTEKRLWSGETLGEMLARVEDWDEQETGYEWNGQRERPGEVLKEDEQVGEAVSEQVSK
jgi:hypothetical protein